MAREPVSKPLHPEQLLETIERHLQEVMSSDPPAREATEDESSDGAPASSEAAAAPLAPLDFAAFVDRCMGDDDFAMQVLSEFQEQFPEQLAWMTAKLQKEDYAELVRDAHTVKGLAANISADALHHAARQLEEVARTGQKAAASASLRGACARHRCRQREAGRGIGCRRWAWADSRRAGRPSSPCSRLVLRSAHR